MVLLANQHLLNNSESIFTWLRIVFDTTTVKIFNITSVVILYHGEFNKGTLFEALVTASTAIAAGIVSRNNSTNLDGILSMSSLSVAVSLPSNKFIDSLLDTLEAVLM